MLFSNPQLDLRISLFLFGISILVALIVLGKTRKKELSLIIFSILGNLSFLINIGSRMFDFYEIKWFGLFSILIWPIINIYLIIKFFSKK